MIDAQHCVIDNVLHGKHRVAYRLFWTNWFQISGAICLLLTWVKWKNSTSWMTTPTTRRSDGVANVNSLAARTWSFTAIYVAKRKSRGATLGDQ